MRKINLKNNSIKIIKDQKLFFFGCKITVKQKIFFCFNALYGHQLLQKAGCNIWNAIEEFQSVLFVNT